VAPSPPAKAPDFDPDAAAPPGSGLFGLGTAVEHAGVVVLPVPFEATTSYGSGTALGPAAIARASHQVDLLDREHGRVYETGIAMLPVSRRIRTLSDEAKRLARPIVRRGGPAPGNARHARAVARVDAAGEAVNAFVRREATRHLEAGRLVGVLGGDHSVPFALIELLAERHPGLGILHVDAHADLRPGYEGFAWSHASIMRNVVDRLPAVKRLVQVGVRDFGEAELACIESSGGRIRTHFDADCRRDLLSGGSWDATCRRIVKQLPRTVHVSFDVDGLSPELCPHTGTPVPGGLSWAEACHLLCVLAESGRRVVGFDLCEVSPGPRGDEWDASVGARLLYKLIGCAMRSGGRGRA
jgi:agmatinase